MALSERPFHLASGSGSARRFVAGLGGPTDVTEVEARYRALVENSLDGVLRMGRDEVVVEMNEAMRAMLGYTAEEVAEATLTRDDVVDATDDRFLEFLEARRREGRARGELTFRRKDGTLFPVELTSSAYGDGDGGAWSIFVVRDVSERVLRERALRESEERFGKAFLGSPAPIALVRLRDGRLIDVNPAFSATFGYPEDEAVGSTVGQLGLAVDPEQPRRVLRALQREGTSSETEVTFRTKDGDTGYGILSYEAVELSGEPCVVVLMHDITERKRSEQELKAARERLERAEETAMVMTLNVGLDGRMLKVPARLGRLLGYDEEEILRLRYQDLTHPDDAGREDAHLPRLLAGEISSFEFEKRYLRKGGGVMWVALSVSLVRDERNEPLYFLTYVRDVSEERRIRNELRRRARQQEAVARLAERITPHAGLQEILDLATRTVAEAVGAPFVKVLELHNRGDDLLLRSGVGWTTAVPGETVFRTGHHSLAGITLETDAPIVFPDLKADPRLARIELLHQHDVRSGVSVVIRRGDEEPFGVIGAFSPERDAFGNDDANVLKSIAGLLIGAIEQRRLLDALAHRAHHDELTGLPNRAAFEERLETALRQAERSGEKVAVLFLDLDRFKNVNDSLGHHAGDELLRQIPARIEGTLRGGDLLARLAGDEFVLMLPRVDGGADVAEVAERILGTFREPFVLAGSEVAVQATMGICCYPDDGRSAGDLLRHADTAMYQGKISGRNTFEFYVDGMSTTSSERLRLESELRRALHRGEFELYYQPQVELETRGTTSVEALLRWHHPERGLLLPDAFMRVAEESGLMVPIGAWVMEEAFQRFESWKERGLGLERVAVNVAASQFAQAAFATAVRSRLESAGLEPGHVELEITEAVVQNDPEGVAARLTTLRNLGVHVALDDFGTGYSSLGHLRRLPIDRIKIDGSFTRRIDDEGDEGRDFVAAIIALARSLHLEVLAEGIETKEQLAGLEELGCCGGQGAVFGNPLPAKDLESLLTEGPVPL